ncbi:MFS transporter [Novosphingobium ginsenosidimutans]|uniref:Multidrug efflux pump Tap n=1 Tax=Novosphingobium ginsenosidimutans TaxID=1176536 RepID=A0A5B8S6W6_9SPHN|nr:MFS transporter [Novosphingobium ginsenosidimutans]QEA17120.1 MFS transporter [Novosphingobium ginsenosidimutans]
MSTPTHPLQIRDYRLVWLARFASVAATTAMVVVVAAQTYQIARTDYGYDTKQAAFLIGTLGLAQFIPFLLLTPVAGLVADRMDRRFVGAASSLLDLLVALTLIAANTLGLVSLPLLFVMAALHGAARVFIGPAISSIVPNVVPADILPKAVATGSIAWQSASVLGPALGGFLLARGDALPYVWSAVLLSIAIVGLLFIKPLPLKPKSTEPPLRQISEGARFVWRERFLLGCVSLDLFAVLLGGATAMLPAFAYDVLHVGDEGLGLLRAAPALGAALVALFLAFFPLSRNVGPKMLWAVAIFGAATLAFALSKSFPISLAMLALLGAADQVSVFVRGTLVQLNTPDEMRGRVSSISGLAISASNELGEMQSGLAAGLFGAVWAVALGGVGAIVVTAAWAVLFPELRRAKTFAPQYRHVIPKEGSVP